MRIYIDLLPKNLKSELKRKKLFRRILHKEFLFSLPFLVFIAILLNIYFLLITERNISIVANSVAESQDKYQELNSYEEKFKQVNDTSAKLLQIQAGHFHWYTVFEKINEDIPEGITLTDFSTKDFKIFLVGRARSRDILLNFKDVLGQNQCFEGINVPLSNLVVKDDIDFQMDLIIKKDCLIR